MTLREEVDAIDREQRREFVAMAESGEHDLAQITRLLGEKYRVRYMTVFLRAIEGEEMNLQTSERVIGFTS